MPIVDGKYEAQISTIYASPQEGIEEIKQMIAKSRRIRISNIPPPLLDEFKPLLKDKDLMIILPPNEKPSEGLKHLAPIATTKARIYVNCMGQEANSGKCAKCLIETFEGSWHYAQKW